MARASEDERLPTPVLLAARGIAARTSCLDAYLVYVLPHGFSPRREPARTSTESKTRLKKSPKLQVKYRPRLFKARLSQPRVRENFDFSFVTFWLSNLFILFAL